MGYFTVFSRKFLIGAAIFLSFPVVYSADGGQHGQVAQHKCPCCEKRFDKPQGLSRHMAAMHPKDPLVKARFKEYSECGKMILAERISAHLQAVHSIQDKKLEFTCSVCGMELKNSYSLGSHKGGRAQCSNASLVRKESQGSVGNVNVLTPRGKSVVRKPFRCEECGICFCSAERVKTHQESCTGYGSAKEIKKLSLNCVTCGLSVMSKNMARHAGTHLSEEDRVRRYQCSVCLRGYQGHAQCSEHIRSLREEDTLHDAATIVDIACVPRMEPLAE